MKKEKEISKRIDIRLFYILAWTSAIANTVGFVSNTIFYGLAIDTYFYGVCAVVMIALGLLGKYGKKSNTAAAMILFIINIIEFPVMYYLYGSGRIVYMILGILGIIIFVGKKRRLIWATMIIIYDVVVIAYSALRPSDFVDLTPQSDLGAGVVSFVIVVISLTAMITLLIEQYENQNRELLQMAEELKDMAHKDPLTQLYNRRYLTDYLEPLMLESNSAFSVALLDLDNFKAVNDNYGHVYGDEVLQNFARYMEDAVKCHGIAARFGGEEFMLVIHSIDESFIQSIMDEIGKKLLVFSRESQGFDMTFSGGVEMFHNEDKITKLFNAADEKLYKAKANGKNCVMFEV